METSTLYADKNRVYQLLKEDLFCANKWCLLSNVLPILVSNEALITAFNYRLISPLTCTAFIE